MRFGFRTLTRAICALALLFVLGGVNDALAQGRGNQRGWTQGRHRGWEHSRYYRRDRRVNDTRRVRRDQRRALLLHQRQERRALRGSTYDRNTRRTLLRHQRAERRDFRRQYRRARY
jgi:hypothetical protein